MSEPAEIVAAVAKLGEGRERLYAFTDDQVEALKKLGVPMRPVDERTIVTGVLEDLSDAGFRLFRPDDCDTVTVEDQGTSKHDGYIEGWYPAGTYWLVEKESE